MTGAGSGIRLRVWPRGHLSGAALLLLGQRLQVLGSLKELMADILEQEPFGGFPGPPRSKAILGRFGQRIDDHDISPWGRLIH